VHTQAGDRSDADLEGLAAEIARGRPDRVFLGESEALLRGRAAGSISAVLRRALVAFGVPDASIAVTASIAAAAAAARAEASAADLVLVAPFVMRDAVRDALGLS